MKIAFLFPGQGSQIVGMGKDIYDEYPEAQKTFDNAQKTLNFDLKTLCFDGPQEELNLTANTQPALLTVSASILAVIQSKCKINVSFAAGHSLGEYTAVYFSGGFDLATAVRLVRKRGEAMQNATPTGIGSMAAIIGLDKNQIEDICRKFSGNQVLEPANFNSPSQIVISGHSEAIDRAIIMAKELGAKRSIKLPVSAPFHSSLMKPAAEKMKISLGNADLYPLTIPIITNAEVKEISNISSDELRNSFVKQIVSPVKWQQSIEYMLEKGVDCFVEIGPGRVLTNLLKRISRKSRAFSINSSETLDEFLSDFIGQSH